MLYLFVKSIDVDIISNFSQSMKLCWLSIFMLLQQIMRISSQPLGHNNNTDLVRVPCHSVIGHWEMCE